MSDTFIDKNKNTTLCLENFLRMSKSAEDFMGRYEHDLFDDRILSQALNALVTKYNAVITTCSELAGYSRSYFANVINGVNKDPSRDSLISFCLAMGATFEETEYVLKCAGKQPLYVRNKRDVVIWYGFQKGLGNGELNSELEKLGFKPLYKNKV